MHTLPLFPDHRDYRATPTGIIPAAWLLERGTAAGLMRDLQGLRIGGAIRHRKYVVELSLVDDVRVFYVMDRKRNVIAKCPADFKAKPDDTGAELFEQLTSALNRCYRVVSYFMACVGMATQNTAPVDMNFEAPELRAHYKVYRQLIDLNERYRGVA